MSRSATSPPAMCWARPRSCLSLEAKGSSFPAITSAGPTRPVQPFVVTPCDIFISEATFGLPVFRHPDTGSEIDRLLHRLHAEPERCVLVGAYALGKAQRVIMELRGRAYDEPIYIHGALERLCRLYEEMGVPLGELRLATGAAKAELQGQDHPLPAGRSQRPLVAAAARSDHCHGIGLDAHSPAGAATQRGTAADHLRPCRLG